MEDEKEIIDMAVSDGSILKGLTVGLHNLQALSNEGKKALLEKITDPRAWGEEYCTLTREDLLTASLIYTLNSKSGKYVCFSFK